MVTNLFAAADVRVFYELSRLGVMDQWWHWLALLVAVLAVITVIVAVYRRDNVELPRGIGWLLITLRLLTAAALLVFFLDIQKHSEQHVTKNSRAVLLVDTSQSMAIRDELDAGGDRISRMDALAPCIPKLVDALRQQHDVIVYRFDEAERPSEVGSFSKRESPGKEATSVTTTVDSPGRIRRMAQGAFALFALAIATAVVHGILRAVSWDQQRIVLYLASLFFLGAVITFAVGDLRFGNAFRAQWPWNRSSTSEESPRTAVEAQITKSDEEEVIEAEVDWPAVLSARGTRTRIGDAVSAIVQRERGGPISGITLFTDGNQNQGIAVTEAATAAQDASIPIFPIGVGTDQRPQNVRVAELELPARVYPGDRFPARVYLQSNGLAGQSVRVELLKAPSGGSDQDESLQRFDERIVRLGADGEMIVVDFEVTPSDTGRQTFVARVTPPAADSDPQDNTRRGSVIVVDRQNRVLLFAGGPSRDYQFLRVQLFRDPEATVDVYLQGSPQGSAQDADHVLDEFPGSLAELSEYDSIVAFDPDWTKLSDEQAEALDRWVAEQAGGLIVVAGPVYTPEWTTAVRESAGIRAIKSLYPVSFFRRGAMFSRDRFAATSPSPVELTPEGASSRFLWLTDNAETAMEAWQDFAGIYGNYPIRGIKAGATALATLAGNASAANESSNPFLVSHFYGAGRVLYIGSGELWRLRALDPTYFESLTTRLVRFVSEGRLMQDSERGLLLVDRDRCLVGDTVQVRAILRDEQFRPLVAPSVDVTLKSPQGAVEHVQLVPLKESAREGTFVGQFIAHEDGDYQLQLPLSGTSGLDVLYRDVQSRMPDLEISSPQRNDTVLSDLAVTTHGKYLHGLPAVQDSTTIANLLLPRDQETYLPGTPDRQFQGHLLRWLMTMICGALCWEWLVRRWNRLA